MGNLGPLCNIGIQWFTVTNPKVEKVVVSTQFWNRGFSHVSITASAGDFDVMIPSGEYRLMPCLLWWTLGMWAINSIVFPHNNSGQQLYHYKVNWNLGVVTEISRVAIQCSNKTLIYSYIKLLIHIIITFRLIYFM